MVGPGRVTKPLLDVIEALYRAFDQGTELHGWAIMQSTGRSGPTVYGVLDRMQVAGWLTGRWERENPAPGKPRRRLYRLTEDGRVAAYDLLAARRPEVLWPERAARRGADGTRARGRGQGDVTDRRGASRSSTSSTSPASPTTPGAGGRCD